MAFLNVATTLVISGPGATTLAGPIDIIGVVVPPGGAVTFRKGANQFLALGPGVNDVQFRSASDIVVNGPCTILLRLDVHSGSFNTTIENSTISSNTTILGTYVPGPGTVTGADTIVSALQKLDGNLRLIQNNQAIFLYYNYS